MDGQLQVADLRREVLIMAALSRRSKLVRNVGLTLCTIALIDFPSAAQGCALCYTQAAAAGSRMIHALCVGILILVFPPMGLSVFFTALAYRRRNRFRDLSSSISLHASNDEAAPYFQAVDD